MTGLPILDYLTANPLSAVFFLVAIVLAVTVHEFAHALVALRQGDRTAQREGRVSLNPAAHLDPAGSILFLLAGIGWGKPVPVNPYQLRDGKLGDFYVSIAGIVTNLAVAFIFALPFQILRWTGVDFSVADISAGGNIWLLFCQQMVAVNILLAAFNLLPIPPLDGSKAIGILIPARFDEAYQRYLQLGPVLLIGLLASAFLLNYNLLSNLIDPLRVAFSFLVFLPSSLQ